MNSKLHATRAKDSIEKALKGLHERHPEMGAVADAFASLHLAALDIVSCDAPWPAYAEFDAEDFCAGTPLLAKHMSHEFESLFSTSAEVMLPVIQEAFPAVAEFAERLGTALKQTPELAAKLLHAFFSGEPENLEEIAATLDLPAAALSFLLPELVKPCLKRAAAQLGQLADNDLWYKNHCPVCGCKPDMGYLKEKGDPSEFLMSKAGRLWLHCSMCGHDWRFARLVCPSCGQTDHERLEVLTAAQHPQERIHVCRDCKHYLVVTDLTNRCGHFHADIAPLELVSLDVVAQEKGYSPIAQRPWNSMK